MITYYKGMKALERAAFSATYQTVWCAGPSIEHVHAIRPVKQIVEELIDIGSTAASQTPIATENV
jgi:nitronate monooxygenase